MVVVRSHLLHFVIEVETLNVADQELHKLVINCHARLLRPNIFLPKVLLPEEHGVVETLERRLAPVEDRVGNLQRLRQAEPDKLLDPLHKWILEV